MDKLSPVSLVKIFDTLLATADRLIPCDVYFAKLEDGNTFTRVLLWMGTDEERLIDMDRQENQWICMYEGKSTVCTELVAPALDFHIARRNNA